MRTYHKIYLPQKLKKGNGNNHSQYGFHYFITSLSLGNTNNQFILWREGAESPFLATRQDFQYDLLEGVQDVVTFQLLIEVTDELGRNTARQLTATTTVIIHVLPWTTTQPTSSTKTATTTVSKSGDLALGSSLN